MYSMYFSHSSSTCLIYYEPATHLRLTVLSPHSIHAVTSPVPTTSAHSAMAVTDVTLTQYLPTSTLYAHRNIMAEKLEILNSWAHLSLASTTKRPGPSVC